jgi:hypothetical protein
MKTRFRKSFAHDLRKLKDLTVLTRVRAVIAELEAAQHLEDARKFPGHSHSQDNFDEHGI